MFKTSKKVPSKFGYDATESKGYIERGFYAVKVVLTTLNAKFIHSSLALRYLRSEISEEFPNNKLLEFTIHDVPMNITSRIFQEKPDVIGFSCYIWNIEQTIPVLDMIRHVLPDTLIVLGGPEVSYDSEYWMKRLHMVDVIVKGEGERTFHHVLKACADSPTVRGTDFGKVPGVVYRTSSGDVKTTFPREKIEDLDSIPSPFTSHLEELQNRMVYFEASRGCPFRCQFCLSSIEEGVRYFSLERVKSDLKTLIDAGVRQIKFVDRTFNINKQYAMEIFDFLIRNHKQTTFQFEITADIMRPEVLDFLAKEAPAGLFRFEIGVQSTNDLTNMAVQRRQNFEKLTRTVTMIRESGKIVQHLDLIAGLPHEDYKSFRKTFNDVFALKPDELQLGFLKMLRGTGLRLQAEQFGYRYMEHAPYEILGNTVLPFSDMVRLKQLEDILEKYWNDHKMDHTVKYLVHHVFDSPFDFFQDFGDYWESRGWERIGHQFEDLFVRLLHFLQEFRGKYPKLNEDLLKGFMRLDYILHANHRPRQIPWEAHVTRDEQWKMAQLIYRRMQSEASGFAKTVETEWTPDQLMKHAWIGFMPFDTTMWINEEKIKPLQDEQLLVVLYPLEKGAEKQLLTFEPIRSTSAASV
jgi:anaerobic magnesium-protoporphyrin IX monomethyl ester cyclase